MLLHLLLFSARSAHPDDMDVSVRLRTSHCMVGCASELVVTAAGASRATRTCRTPRRVCALVCVCVCVCVCACVRVRVVPRACMFVIMRVLAQDWRTA